MKYREIVAVSGMPGLFQLKATKSDGAIVKSLEDGSSRFLPSRTNTVTQLESIEVYTNENNVLLHHVFQSMKDNDSLPRPDSKKASNDDIRNYFRNVFPDFDFERVYVSDMKKMLKWYEVLKKNDLLHFEIAQQNENDSEQPVAEEADAETPIAEEKPAKKSRAKKEATTDVAVEEKPKKASAKKKKNDEAN
jgi:hypothetical protein